MSWARAAAEAEAVVVVAVAVVRIQITLHIAQPLLLSSKHLQTFQPTTITGTLCFAPNLGGYRRFLNTCRLEF
ncbi:Protein of unknown function [Gryllus bimaculatus]|nr:Protein of unknown function [Gryllus bimaculatus]